MPMPIDETFPTTADELSLDWFNTATEQRIGATASAIYVEPLHDAGDGFYGSHLKIAATYRGEEQPRVFVAKLSPRNPEASAAVNRINCFEREVNFYRHLADQSPVRVPTCYFAEYDATRGESLLLLEFVDGMPGNHVAGATREQAEAAMRTAAHLHGYWKGDPAIDGPWLDHLTDRRFTGAMAEAAEDAVPLALEKMPGIAPDWMLDQAPRVAEILTEQAHALNELPQTLIHFDYQIPNLMFPAARSPGAPTLIDWQCTVRGPGAWDVSVFCIMSLPVERRRAWERELILIYLSELEGKPVSAWPDWFEEVYGRVAISFVAHMIRNAPMFDYDDPNVVAIVRELFQRVDRAIEDHDARHLASTAGL